jgi:hypothetical protein
MAGGECRYHGPGGARSGSAAGSHRSILDRRIQMAEKRNDEAAALPATVGFEADLTRVITLMIGREGGNRTYASIGVPDAHHGLSHYFNDAAKRCWIIR